jgi:hypothetical protein
LCHFLPAPASAENLQEKFILKVARDIPLGAHIRTFGIVQREDGNFWVGIS